MFAKIAIFGAALALSAGLGVAPARAASPTARCCATKTRCCPAAKHCCDQPDQAACCQSGTACCGQKDCCGQKKSAAACAETGLAPRVCCATKASPMPPCCNHGCPTAGQVNR